MQLHRLILNLFHKKTIYLLLSIYLSWFVGIQILKSPLNPFFIGIPLILFIVVYPIKGLWVIIGANLIYGLSFTVIYFKVWKAHIFLNDILLIFIFIGIILDIFLKILKKEPISLKWGTLEYAILFYVFVNFLNVIFVVGRSDLTGAMADAHNVLFFVAYFITIYLIRDISDIKPLMWIWFLGSIIISVLGFNRFFTGVGTMFISEAEGLQRYIGGSAALLLSFTTIFSLILLTFNRYRKKIIIFILFIFLFAIVISFIRAAWLALFAGVLTLFFSLSITQKARFVKIISLFFIATIIFMSILIVTPLIEKIVGPLEHRIEDIGSRDIKTTSGYRIEMWKIALDEISKHPFIGKGWGTEEFRKYYLKDTSYFIESVHNSYLELALRTGLIGLFSLLMIFCIFIIKMVQAIRILKDDTTQRAYLIGILCSFVSILVFAMFGPVFKTQYVVIFLWILMGLGMSLARSTNQSRLTHNSA